MVVDREIQNTKEEHRRALSLREREKYLVELYFSERSEYTSACINIMCREENVGSRVKEYLYKNDRMMV